MGFMAGKRGLVTGVLHETSIATAISQTFAHATPTAFVSDAATVAEIAEPATMPPGTNFSRFVTA